jgi:hypothetical protein
MFPSSLLACSSGAFEHRDLLNSAAQRAQTSTVANFIAQKQKLTTQLKDGLGPNEREELEPLLGEGETVLPWPKSDDVAERESDPSVFVTELERERGCGLLPRSSGGDKR